MDVDCGRLASSQVHSQPTHIDTSFGVIATAADYPSSSLTRTLADRLLTSRVVDKDMSTTLTHPTITHFGTTGSETTLPERLPVLGAFVCYQADNNERNYRDTGEHAETDRQDFELFAWNDVGAGCRRCAFIGCTSTSSLRQRRVCGFSGDA